MVNYIADVDVELHDNVDDPMSELGSLSIQMDALSKVIHMCSV